MPRTCRGCSGAAPVVLGQGIAKSAGASEFLTIKGIDPALEGTVTECRASMEAGSLERPDAGALDHRRHRHRQGAGEEARRHHRRRHRSAHARWTADAVRDDARQAAVQGRRHLQSRSLRVRRRARDGRTWRWPSEMLGSDPAGLHRGAASTSMFRARQAAEAMPSRLARNTWRRIGRTRTSRCSRRSGSRRWPCRSPSA